MSTKNRADPWEPGRALSNTDLAQIFKALGEPIRIRLLMLIGHASTAECGFTDLARIIDIPQSSLSHHLHVMVNAGVLVRKRRGTSSWYAVESSVSGALQEFNSMLTDH